MKRHQISEAAWAAGGQGATALGTLLGVRLLTQFVSPPTFGTVSLALAASSLTLSVANSPISQAALFLYPGFASRGTLNELYNGLYRCMRLALVWTVPLLAVGGLVYVASGSGSVLFVAVFVALLVSDFWRATHQAMLGAARQQRRYSLWTASDAWARPLLATAAVLVFDRSPSTVLAAHLIVAVTLLVIFTSLKSPANTARRDLSSAAAVLSTALDRRMWAYALPLIPLGIIAWVNNLGDRYFIGATLGVASVGAYAAVYGIASAPFMLFGTAVELALRPVYQAAVTAEQHERAHKLLKLWIAVITTVCGVGVVVVAVWHDRIAAILLAPPYRHASALMPLISGGYAVRCVAYVFERVCYAHGETRRVLLGQVFAVAVTLIATPVGVLGWGLPGAAAAVPVCFTVQLAAVVFLTRGLQKQVQSFA